MNNEERISKKRILKFVGNGLILLCLISLTFRILLKEQNIGELFDTIRSARLPFILIGLLCMMLFYVCDAINMRRTLKALGEECSLLMAVKYVLIGIFFSDITPAATGGQPMQVIYMRKDGIKASSSTLALVLNLFSFQSLTIGLAIISGIFLYSRLEIGMKIFLIVGILLNSISLILVTIGIFSTKLSGMLVIFVAKILKFFRVKNYEEKERKLQESLATYHESAKYIRESNHILIKQFITGLIQQVFYYSVPFCVLYAFNLPLQNYFLMLGLQAMVFAMASGIPLPGAVGVSEGAFVNTYRPIFTEEYINGAVILSRGINFYLPLIICAVVVLWSTITKSKK